MTESLGVKRKREDEPDDDEMALNPNVDTVDLGTRELDPIGTDPIDLPIAPPAAPAAASLKVPIPLHQGTGSDLGSNAATFSSVTGGTTEDSSSGVEATPEQDTPVENGASKTTTAADGETLVQMESGMAGDKSTEGSPEENKSTSEDLRVNENATKTGEDVEVNSYTNLRWDLVENNGTRQNLIRLIGLKNLFSKQLPKMPKDYIVRLVFDKRHKSLAILSSDPKLKDTDDEIMGAICYRSYPEMRFAEIAFCAVSQAQQVKGYGTKLMNLLKMHMVTQGIEYFITYADNYATGYFKKQGFTRTITMPKSRYHGLIKDYDGGTLMECYVHPSIDYTRIPEMIKAQRQFILDRIRTVSKSDKVVYPPLPKGWTPNRTGHSSRGSEAAVRAFAIPGMAEAGWTMADLLASTAAAKDNDRQRNYLKSEMLAIVRKVEEQHFAWPFREPVDTTEVKDYLDVIKEPIDILTMEKRIRKGNHYKSKKQLYDDMMMMVKNCKTYNDASSPYYECAINLDKYIKTLFVDL